MTNPAALNANPGKLALRRLDAVEAMVDRMRARERARDDLIDMALGSLSHLLRPHWPSLADEVKRRHAVLYGNDPGPDMTDRAVECLNTAPPQDGNPDPMPSDPMTESRAWVRHVKCGTEYEVLGQAQIQTETPLADDDLVMIYRGSDGVLWARPTDEFRDGRFAPCIPPVAPCADEVEVVARAFLDDGDFHGNAVAEGYYRRIATIAIAALATLRAAERERAFRRGWKAGAEAMQDACLDAGDGVKTAMAMRMCIAEVPVPPAPAQGGGDGE